jgi:hypothetical protein
VKPPVTIIIYQCDRHRRKCLLDKTGRIVHADGTTGLPTDVLCDSTTYEERRVTRLIPRDQLDMQLFARAEIGDRHA